VTALGWARFPWRITALGAVSCLLYLGGSGWQPPLERTNQPLFLIWFSAVFLVYAAAVLQIRVQARQSHPRLLPLIIGWAVIFRLLLLWITPGFLSDDIYRYVWDGLVQRAGINPYLYPPEAPELAFLRDDTIFPMINRKWALTLYPPGAQLFFRLMAWLSPAHVVAMKAVILLADVVSIGLLVLLLGRLGLPPSYVLIYAWQPLVIVELGISGHLDGLMLPFVLLALFWMTAQRPALTGVALALATLIKLYPALLLPVFLQKRNLSMPLVFGGTVIAGYALYLEAGRQIIGYLPHYIAPDEFYNLSVRPILMWLVGHLVAEPFPYVKWLSIGVILATMWRCVRQPERSPQQAIAWGVALIALYLFVVSPSVFQWYLVWLLALATLTPGWLTPAWLYWSWSVYFGYLEHLPGFGEALHWLYVIEYSPVFAWIVGYGWWVHTKRTVERDASPYSPSPPRRGPG
jgi:alpha-1,6-mannosyltransferase